MAISRFGYWLQAAMDHAHIRSQRELGQLVGKSHTTISRWLIGEYKPGHKAIASLASALGTSRAEIYEILGFIPTFNPGLSKSKRRLMDKVLALDEDQLRIAEADIDYLLERQELLQTEAQTETQTETQTEAQIATQDGESLQ